MKSNNDLLRRAALLSIALAASGCGLIKVRTSGSQGGHGSSSGGPSLVPTDDHSKNRYVGSAVRTHDKALEMSQAKDMTAMEREEALDMWRSCVINASAAIDPVPADHEVETKSGTMTLKELEQRCRAQTEELKKRAVPGCGVLKIGASSLSTGGGSWTPAELSTGMTYEYEAIPCKEKYETERIGAAFRSLVPRIRELCHHAEAKIRTQSEWQNVPLRSGQVRRQARIRCFLKGTRADWGERIQR